MKTLASENTEDGVGRISAAHPARALPDALRLSGLRKLIGAILPQINEFGLMQALVLTPSPLAGSVQRGGARYQNISTHSVPSVAKIKSP